MATQSFYCSLCEEFSSDENLAEAHLKTDSHNQKFQRFVDDNPQYERTYNLEKAGRVLIKPDPTKDTNQASKIVDAKKTKESELMKAQSLSMIQLPAATKSSQLVGTTHDSTAHDAVSLPKSTVSISGAASNTPSSVLVTMAHSVENTSPKIVVNPPQPVKKTLPFIGKMPILRRGAQLRKSATQAPAPVQPPPPPPPPPPPLPEQIVRRRSSNEMDKLVAAAAEAAPSVQEQAAAFAQMTAAWNYPLYGAPYGVPSAYGNPWISQGMMISHSNESSAYSNPWISQEMMISHPNESYAYGNPWISQEIMISHSNESNLSYAAAPENVETDLVSNSVVCSSSNDSLDNFLSIGDPNAPGHKSLPWFTELNTSANPYNIDLSLDVSKKRKLLKQISTSTDQQSELKNPVKSLVSIALPAAIKGPSRLVHGLVSSVTTVPSTHPKVTIVKAVKSSIATCQNMPPEMRKRFNVSEENSKLNSVSVDPIIEGAPKTDSSNPGVNLNTDDGVIDSSILKEKGEFEIIPMIACSDIVSNKSVEDPVITASDELKIEAINIKKPYTVAVDNTCNISELMECDSVQPPEDDKFSNIVDVSLSSVSPDIKLNEIIEDHNNKRHELAQTCELSSLCGIEGSSLVVPVTEVMLSSLHTDLNRDLTDNPCSASDARIGATPVSEAIRCSTDEMALNELISQNESSLLPTESVLPEDLAVTTQEDIKFEQVEISKISKTVLEPGRNIESDDSVKSLESTNVGIQMDRAEMNLKVEQVSSYSYGDNYKPVPSQEADVDQKEFIRLNNSSISNISALMEEDMNMPTSSISNSHVEGIQGANSILLEDQNMHDTVDVPPKPLVVVTPDSDELKFEANSIKKPETVAVDNTYNMSELMECDNAQRPEDDKFTNIVDVSLAVISPDLKLNEIIEDHNNKLYELAQSCELTFPCGTEGSSLVLPVTEVMLSSLNTDLNEDLTDKFDPCSTKDAGIVATPISEAVCCSTDERALNELISRNEPSLLPAESVLPENLAVRTKKDIKSELVEMSEISQTILKPIRSIESDESVKSLELTNFDFQMDTAEMNLKVEQVYSTSSCSYVDNYKPVPSQEMDVDQKEFIGQNNSSISNIPAFMEADINMATSSISNSHVEDILGANSILLEDENMSGAVEVSPNFEPVVVGTDTKPDLILNCAIVETYHDASLINASVSCVNECTNKWPDTENSCIRSSFEICETWSLMPEQDVTATSVCETELLNSKESIQIYRALVVEEDLVHEDVANTNVEETLLVKHNDVFQSEVQLSDSKKIELNIVGATLKTSSEVDEDDCFISKSEGPVEDVNGGATAENEYTFNTMKSTRESDVQSLCGYMKINQTVGDNMLVREKDRIYVAKTSIEPNCCDIYTLPINMPTDAAVTNTVSDSFTSVKYFAAETEFPVKQHEVAEAEIIDLDSD